MHEWLVLLKCRVRICVVWGKGLPLIWLGTAETPLITAETGANPDLVTALQMLLAVEEGLVVQHSTTLNVQQASAALLLLDAFFHSPEAKRTQVLTPS